MTTKQQRKLSEIEIIQKWKSEGMTCEQAKLKLRDRRGEPVSEREWSLAYDISREELAYWNAKNGSLWEYEFEQEEFIAEVQGKFKGEFNKYKKESVK